VATIDSDGSHFDSSLAEGALAGNLLEVGMGTVGPHIEEEVVVRMEPR
jgi:hypothetical protein